MVINMLKLKLIKDMDILKEKLPTPKNTAYGYEAILDEKYVGMVVGYLENSRVTVCHLNITDQLESEYITALADGLLRALFDKSANENMLYYGFTKDIAEGFADTLDKQGYVVQGDYIYKFFTSTHKCTGCGGCNKEGQ